MSGYDSDGWALEEQQMEDLIAAQVKEGFFGPTNKKMRKDSQSGHIYATTPYLAHIYG
jgi:hypothetical protein